MLYQLLSQQQLVAEAVKVVVKAAVVVDGLQAAEAKAVVVDGLQEAEAKAAVVDGLQVEVEVKEVVAKVEEVEELLSPS